MLKQLNSYWPHLNISEPSPSGSAQQTVSTLTAPVAITLTLRLQQHHSTYGVDYFLSTTVAPQGGVFFLFCFFTMYTMIHPTSKSMNSTKIISRGNFLLLHLNQMNIYWLILCKCKLLFSSLILLHVLWWRKLGL